MSLLLRDAHGAELGAGDENAVGLLDEAVQELVALMGDPVAKADAAAAADPELALARAFQAYLQCYGASEPGYRAAAAVLADAPKARCQRDQAHLEAASAWAAGQLDQAVGQLERALLTDPHDLLALKVAQDLYFFLGDRANLRDVVARVLPAWPRGAPDAGFVEAMYAFGLEECGDYRAAERHGRAALGIFRGDVWAAHAVIHVLEMEGRQAEGTQFVAASAPDWRASYFAVHNWWHSAVYQLELGAPLDALAVYDGPVQASGLQLPLDQIDAASLLWRLWLQGVAPGPRATELADALGPGLGRSTYCFNDWHAVMALALAGRLDVATELVAGLAPRATGTNKTMVERAGLDVARGTLAFAAGDYGTAVDRLWVSRRQANIFGGSHAQRDAIDLTLLAAAAAAHDRSLVRALLAERVARKPSAEPAARRLVEVWG